MSEDPQKPAAVAAGDEETRVQDAAAAQQTAASDEAAAQADRADAEARAAEIREEVRITDERRAEEELAKAQEAEEAAEREIAKREQKRREAEERRQAAAADAERAREHAGEAEEQARAAQPSGTVSGASVTSPGVGIETDPKAAATASAGARATPQSRTTGKPEQVEGPDKPEIQVAAAFGGAFLVARILKAIAG